VAWAGNVEWGDKKMIAGLPVHTKSVTAVASFRTWRSSWFLVAQDPAIKIKTKNGGEDETLNTKNIC